MTYGDLKFRLVQMFPGVSIDLLEGFINDRYADILGELPWSRLEVQGILETTAPYTTGTVTLTPTNAVTLTGGTWTTDMSGRAFRVAGRQEFYEFTWVSATSGLLDRPYEGPSASGAAYSIFQFVYPLPSDARQLNDNAFAPLLRMSHAELQQGDRWRQQTSSRPMMWSSYMSDSSTPPRMQVELYPSPTAAVGLPFTYLSDGGALDDSNAIVQLWFQPTALLQGVVGLVKSHLKDYNGAQLAMAMAERAMKNMRSSEAQGAGPSQLQLDPYFTRHRLKRGR